MTVPEPPLQSPGVGTGSAASPAPRGGDAPGERHTGLGTMGTAGEQGSGTQVSRAGGTGGLQTPLGLGVAVPSGAALHQQSPPWILGPRDGAGSLCQNLDPLKKRGGRWLCSNRVFPAVGRAAPKAHTSRGGGG